jgi:translation initiation factor IF-1
MAKEDIIMMEGRVEEVLPATMFRIKLDNIDALVLGHLSGRMRKNNIKVLLGDRVEMEFSPYDLTKGRITRRR